jgi:asparagine synthase (glutamine-hydrolysing)
MYDFKVHSIGRQASIDKFISTLDPKKLPDMQVLKKELASLYGCYGLIVESKNWILAAVDKVRGYPIFYTTDYGSFQTSNSARLLQQSLPPTVPIEEVLLNFKLSGFFAGSDTACPYVRQLRAGEALLWEKESIEPKLFRYFQYLPCEERGREDKDWLEEFSELNDVVFDRLVEDAKGRPIWVPLSGGLDSRLIVSMLRQRDCELRTFSYGLPGNYEAKVAKRVAAEVGVPWQFEPVTRSAYKKFFHSNERRAYWAFGDNLSSVPNMQDFLPLKDMVAEGRLPQNAYLVNGQSGDFISGGHLPLAMQGKETSWEIMFDELVAKHFSQWLHLKNSNNLSLIEEHIKRELSMAVPNPYEYHDKAALYEYWEWQERQSKYIVNGQRVYDWLQLDWSLPLWEKEYLDFWRRVPLRLKYGQKLYKNYLKTKNYFGVFEDFKDNVWRWPGMSIIIVPVARVIGLFGGRKSKEWVYHYCSYLGHYGNIYSGIGLNYYLRNIGRARGGFSMFIDMWLKDNLPELEDHCV